MIVCVGASSSSSFVDFDDGFGCWLGWVGWLGWLGWLFWLNFHFILQLEKMMLYRHLVIMVDHKMQSILQMSPSSPPLEIAFIFTNLQKNMWVNGQYIHAGLCGGGVGSGPSQRW